MRLTDAELDRLRAGALERRLRCYSVLPCAEWDEVREQLLRQGITFLSVTATDSHRQPYEVHVFSAVAPPMVFDCRTLTEMELEQRLTTWLRGRTDDEVETG